MEEIIYRPIGVIHSPFRSIEEMPIQPSGAQDVLGTVEIEPEYADGLEGFSHIFLLYSFHLSKGYSLKIKPFLDENLHGMFATRAPRRPNPIGISVVRLLGVEGCDLQIADVDIIDGTPLLDIKPYVPEFDVREVERVGWLSRRADMAYEARSDDRFT